MKLATSYGELVKSKVFYLLQWNILHNNRSGSGRCRFGNANNLFGVENNDIRIIFDYLSVCWRIVSDSSERCWHRHIELHWGPWFDRHSVY